jgi:PmbA protein
MSEGLEPDRLHAALDACLDVKGAAAVQASATHSWGGLTRFASSVIHQNVASESNGVEVTVVLDDGRRGYASGGDLDPGAAASIAQQALDAARLAPPDPEFPGVAGPQSYASWPDRFDEETANASPADRAKAVSSGLEVLRTGQHAAGRVTTTAVERAIGTSGGARGYGSSTAADVVVAVTSGNGGTGYDAQSASRLSTIDAVGRAASAAATCAAADNPQAIDPGTYEVVLHPDAVGNLLFFLAILAFDAKAYQEGRSPLCNRLGEVVASPLVTIRDDASRPGMSSMPFDGEAMPKTAVDLIVDGVATGLVYDRETARRAGRESTGHGAGSPETGPAMGFGALANNLVLEPGSGGTTEDLIAGMERGLVVTRFWYTRVVDPMRTMITGMTRDGTFLVEDGRIVKSVRNLRWNESILDLLTNCTAIGKEPDQVWGAVQTPALRASSFTCTAQTDH